MVQELPTQPADKIGQGPWGNPMAMSAEILEVRR
jgi:hypothetical protein